MAAFSDPSEDVDLLPHVRQLVTKIEPTIKDADSWEVAEDRIHHLEEHDQNFHRYEYVKYIKMRIEEILGPAIEEEIQRRGGQSRSNENVEKAIAKKITSSELYAHMRRELGEHTKDAVDRLVRTFDEEKNKDGVGEKKVAATRPGHPIYSFSDSDSSLSSSFNHGSDYFLSVEQLQKIADNLKSSNTIDARRSALQKLCTIPPSEVLASDDQWNSLKATLMQTLTEPDEQMADKCLRFLARMFLSGEPKPMKGAYKCLVDHLDATFRFRNKSIGLIKEGLDINQPAQQRLLKKFRLMNEFQYSITQFWVRFSERFVEDILDSTLSLLAIQPILGTKSTSKSMTPMHYLSILDPKSKWFKKWMHGNFSRVWMLKLLEKHRSLIDSAVKRCIEVINDHTSSRDAIEEINERLQKEKITDGDRTQWTGKELEYVYFLHSLCIVGSLLMYNRGRNLFPIKTKHKEVTVTEFLVKLVSLLSIADSSQSVKRSSYNPGLLAADVLKMLATSQSVCEECLCKDVIVQELIGPVKKLIENKKGKPVPVSSSSSSWSVPTQASLLNIAEILAALASSQIGRHVLLYGEKGNKYERKKSAAIHTIAEFSRKALTGSLPQDMGIAPSKAVISGFVFICRQLYNSCEGLYVLYPYELHTCLAATWREANRELENMATPVPASEGEEDDYVPAVSQQESQEIIEWEKTLIDNLLNFAGTPKGLLLLQQTSTINECVAYMYDRYNQKLQVSKHEKFGYGTMVTQVASTSPGMIALQSTGFIKALLNELWSVLECPPDERRIIRPSPIPVEVIDRPCHKYFIVLLNILSAFPAFCEVVGDQPLSKQTSYSFRDVTDTIIGFLERVVMVDSPEKIHSLFNVEQSQVFGLRVLSITCCSLDSFLLLETQYHLQDMLLAGQENSRREDGGDPIIVDGLTVERNHILVRTNLIGGPSERKVPPRSLQDGSAAPYPWPLFSQLPLPSSYTPNLVQPSAIKQESELTKFLSSTKGVEMKPADWMDKCRKAFCSVLTRKPELANGKVLVEMLERALSSQLKNPEESIFNIKDFNFNDSMLKKQKLSKIQTLGIQMAIRYGTHLKILHKESESTENLTVILKKCRLYLSKQEVNVPSESRSLQAGFMGHDWFSSTIFLIMSGNKEKCWNFLYKFTSTLSSAYLWLARLHRSVQLPSQLRASGIHPLFSTTGHNIELILQAEVPLVHSAFRISGYTPSQICQHWLRQCFWNYLDWQDICHYLCVCIMMGIDYQVYVCVAVLKYLQRSILQHTQSQQLQVFLMEESIEGFRVGQHLEYMQQLQQKYRQVILPDMLNIKKP